ncbi:hypothetical protein JXI42_02650 [bacterium]|nr:hypothetical protein [bacterium]
MRKYSVKGFILVFMSVIALLFTSGESFEANIENVDCLIKKFDEFFAREVEGDSIFYNKPFELPPELVYDTCRLYFTSGTPYSEVPEYGQRWVKCSLLKNIVHIEFKEDASTSEKLNLFEQLFGADGRKIYNTKSIKFGRRHSEHFKGHTYQLNNPISEKELFSLIYEINKSDKVKYAGPIYLSEREEIIAGNEIIILVKTESASAVKSFIEKQQGLNLTFLGDIKRTPDVPIELTFDKSYNYDNLHFSLLFYLLHKSIIFSRLNHDTKVRFH